jgi:hypothetical protein
MVDRKSTELSPESIVRTNRKRLAVEEGARAMADVEQEAVAVRKNMERLRALREAKEADEARKSAVVPLPAKKKKGFSR